MARATKTPAAPAGVAVCVMSFSGQLPSGEEVSFNAGSRVSADNEAVRHFDKHFVMDGATDKEVAQAAFAIVDERPVRQSQYVRALREIHSVIGKGGLSSGWGPIQKGAIIPFDHEIHRAHPKDFELVE
jgi:hypothetical protein